MLDESLDPEVIKGNPYCMNAFKYMFNNSRVPAEGSDITQHYDGEANRFFIVIYKTTFTKFQLTMKVVKDYPRVNFIVTCNKLKTMPLLKVLDWVH